MTNRPRVKFLVSVELSPRGYYSTKETMREALQNTLRIAMGEFNPQIGYSDEKPKSQQEQELEERRELIKELEDLEAELVAKRELYDRRYGPQKSFFEQVHEVNDIVDKANETASNSLPHTKACGAKPHEHGNECHSSCPTCGGKPISFTRLNV